MYVCVRKKHSSKENYCWADRQIGFQSTKSGAGEQFLLRGCNAEVCVKGVVVHIRYNLKSPQAPDPRHSQRAPHSFFAHAHTGMRNALHAVRGSFSSASSRMICVYRSCWTLSGRLRYETVCSTTSHRPCPMSLWRPSRESTVFRDTRDSSWPDFGTRCFVLANHSPTEHKRSVSCAGMAWTDFGTFQMGAPKVGGSSASANFKEIQGKNSAVVQGQPVISEPP